MRNSLAIRNLRPGDHVRVLIDGRLWTYHHLLIDEFGRALHLTMERGRGGTDPLHHVLGDRVWNLVDRPPPGDVTAILRRARSVLDRPYDLLRWNCESFVQYAKGGGGWSVQVVRGGLILTGIAALVAAAWVALGKRDP